MISRSDLAAIFRKMADEIEAVVSEQPIPEVTPEPAPAPEPVIDLGTVKGIQHALNQLSNLPKIAEDGVHGPVTTYVLKIFQALTQIPVTGEADEATINTIHKNLFGRT